MSHNISLLHFLEQVIYWKKYRRWKQKNVVSLQHNRIRSAPDNLLVSRLLWKQKKFEPTTENRNRKKGSTSYLLEKQRRWKHVSRLSRSRHL